MVDEEQVKLFGRVRIGGARRPALSLTYAGNARGTLSSLATRAIFPVHSSTANPILGRTICIEESPGLLVLAVKGLGQAQLADGARRWQR